MARSITTATSTTARKPARVRKPVPLTPGQKAAATKLATGAHLIAGQKAAVTRAANKAAIEAEARRQARATAKLRRAAVASRSARA